MDSRGGDALALGDCKGMARYIRWMLRSGANVDFHFLMGLAKLLDPECKSEEFQLIAQRRSAGTPSKEFREAWVVARVNEKLAAGGGPKKTIYHDVGAEVGLSASRVAEICRSNKSTNK